MSNRDTETAVADNRDYTDPNRTYSGETPFSNDEIGDFEFGDGQSRAPDISADEIEATGSFKLIPPMVGVELEIVGFVPPKKGRAELVYHAYKNCLYNGREESYAVDTVKVKFAALSGQVAWEPQVGPDKQPILDDSGKQVFKKINLDKSYHAFDQFELLPTNILDSRCYMEGTNLQGKAKGFMASKFFHFLHRIGFPWEAGGPIPEDARKLKNWLGRKVIANIVAGEPYEKNERDKDGLEIKKTYPGYPKVELMSYRIHPSIAAEYEWARELASREGSANATPPTPAKPSSPPVTTTRPTNRPTSSKKQPDLSNL